MRTSRRQWPEHASATRSIIARFVSRWRSGRRSWLVALSAALVSLGGGVAEAFAVEGPSTATPFAALHTYYVSPTGNDGNPGTRPEAPWASAHHNVQCGDVIIVAPGRYVPGQYGSVFGANDWGTVSNCPSTSGGIDGTGGVYFAILLCAGPNMTSCTIDGGASEAVRVDQSHWAVEGFYTTQKDNTSSGCMTATSETDEVVAFVAFINDIASTCSIEGFGTFGWTAKGGVDQSAVVGAIAYNASSSIGGGICGSGVSIIPANGSEPTSGTHVFVAGFFGYRNVNAPSGLAATRTAKDWSSNSWSCSGGDNLIHIRASPSRTSGGPTAAPDSRCFRTAG